MDGDVILMEMGFRTKAMHVRSMLGYQMPHARAARRPCVIEIETVCMTLSINAPINPAQRIATVARTPSATQTQIVMAFQMPMTIVQLRGETALSVPGAPKPAAIEMEMACQTL